jgi:hypothetical protein
VTTRVVLRVLAFLLLLWQPASFARVASLAIPSLGYRGWLAGVELIVAGAIAAVSVAAWWSLVTRQPHGIPLARIALMLSAARSIQSLYWTMLPSDVVPGTETIYTAAIIGFTAGWLLYLGRSRAVRAQT